MKNSKLTIIAVAISTLLAACNDGSGFVSTQDTEAQAPAAGGESNAIRNMVGDNGNSIEAINGDSPASEGAINLIDGDVNTKFLNFAPQAEVLFSATKSYALVSYQLTSANDAPGRDPSAWTLEGSNDKESWQVVDDQSGQIFSERFMTREFDLTGNEAEYQYYRFSFQNTGIDDWGNDIFQLAELKLFVKADAPLTEFTVSNKTPNVGDYVIFKDESLANPTSWQWTFEGGEPSSSNEASPLVFYNTLGPKTVTLVASNDKGETRLVKENFIRVWDESDAWAGFPKPTVSYVKNLPEHPGQAALERVLPDLTDVIQEISLSVAKMLYNNVTEIKVFETLTFETGQYDFPAAKSGTDKDMILMFDLDHIATIEMQGEEALRREVMGVLWHELTHGYNQVPDSGVYQAGNELHSFLEGLANTIRLQAGYIELAPKWIESWNEDAYNQTSLFLDWVANSHRNTDFIRLFNASAGEIKNWTFDKAFQSIFGVNRGIDVVFAEYQDYLQTIGISPPYPTPVNGFENFAIDEGVIVTTNATHIGIWGEGPDKLVDNNVRNKFNAVIEEPWWIPQYAPDLSPINEVDNVVVTLEVPEETVLAKYSVTTGNDNAHRDPTMWTVLASNNGESWTELDSDSYPSDPERLTTYHYDIDSNDTAYRFYQFIFENTQEGAGIGGDDGRLIQIGELALLKAQ
ncbi:basic secretory protein-like protein [Colwelliaceae bacterium 6441]